MRFLLIILVALALGFAWQSSVIAADSAKQKHPAADKESSNKSKKNEDTKQDNKNGQGDDDSEPDCD